MLSVYSLPRTGPRVSRSFLLKMKTAVLGEAYELSVAFVTESAMQKVNRIYRKKHSSTDILSFSLSPHSGEILFSMKDVKKRAPHFRRSASNFISFLFIHGLLHLKGYAHGSRMERQEKKSRRRFKV